LPINTRLVVSACLLALACGGDDGETVDDDTTIDGLITFDDDDDEPTDTAVPLQDYTGMTGTIVVVHWPASVNSEDESYSGAALFTDLDGGLLNGAHCILYGAPCVIEWPAVGESLIPEIDTSFLNAAEFFEVGDAIDVGSDSFPIDPNYTVPVYIGVPTGFGTTGGIALDGDYMPYEGTDDFTYAGAMEVTSPPTDTRIEVTTGDSIDFAWTPGGEGEVILTVKGTIYHLDDTGSFTLDVDDIGFFAPLDTTSVQLSRVTNSEIDAAGNTIQIETRSEQWFYIDFEDTVGWTELTLDNEWTETCAEAIGLPPLAAGQYYGDLTGMDDDHDLGDQNDTTGWATAGFEGVSAVHLLAGETLTATMRQTVLDAAVYILDGDCDPDEPLAGTDDTFNGEEEVVEYTATNDETVYIVMDGWFEGGTFSLVLDIN